MKKEEVNFLLAKENFLEMMQAEQNASKNTIISYDTDLRLFITYLRENNIAIISKDVVQNFRKILVAQKLKSRSIARKISSLRKFLEFLRYEGIISKDFSEFLELPKIEKSIPKFISFEDVKKLLLFLENDNSYKELRLSVMLELLYSTGMRVSELVSLKLGDLRYKDFEKFSLEDFLCICGKGGKERIVPLNEISKNKLKKFVSIRGNTEYKDSSFLFASSAKEGHLTRQRFAQLLKEVARDVGIDERRVSPHVIRHSFATHLLENGIDLRVLQEILGHSNIATTEIYTHLQNKHLREVVEKYHPLA